MATPIHRFEDLLVWQEGVKLSEDIYRALNTCQDFWLRNQMLRAALSIPSNIAEGYEKMYNREFIRFLKIAKGSAGELRTQLYVAQKVGLLTDEVASHFISRTQSISAMLQKLVQVRQSWRQNFLLYFLS